MSFLGKLSNWASNAYSLGKNLYGTVSGLGKKVYKGLDRGLKFLDSKPVKSIVGGLDSLIPNNDIRNNYLKMKNYGGAMKNKVGDFNGTVKKYGNIGSDMIQTFQNGSRETRQSNPSLQRDKPKRQDRDETYLGGLFQENTD